MARITNDGKRGGVLKGKPHYDSNGNPAGGIKAVIGDGEGKRPVELEGGEVIINKEASKKHWKKLSEINQSAGNGVPIHKPDGGEDEDIDPVYKEGGNVKKIVFNPNHLPNRWVIAYGVKLKKNHPEIWKMAGNIFGNEAFNNLKRVLDRGYWLDSEEWMYVKWRSYVARHAGDKRINGVIAMIKWGDKIDLGWAYMKSLVEKEIQKDKSKTMFGEGGRVDIAEWETKEPELFKCLLTVRALVEGNAKVEDSFVDTHNKFYVIKYEDSNPYFDAIITETCKTLTECGYYLKVDEVEVTNNFVLVPFAQNLDVRFEKGGNFTGSGIAGDIYSLNDRGQFSELVTIYNDLSENHGVAEYYIDNNENSVVFILNGRIDARNKKTIRSYLSGLEGKGMRLLDSKSVKWGKGTNSDYFKVRVNGVLKYADGGPVGFFKESDQNDATGFKNGFIPATGTLISKDKKSKLDYIKVGNDYEFSVYDGEPNPVENYSRVQYKKRDKNKVLMNYNQFIAYLYSEGFMDDKLQYGGGADKMASASSRFRPYGVINFNPPVIGPNGNKLTSYEWKYEWTMVPNWEGELVGKRISDWTQAEKSAETGRDLVHQFNVERKDGVSVTVSSESVSSLLGYTEGNSSKKIPSLVNSLKTLARLKMAVAVGREQKKAYDELYKKLSAAKKPEIKEIPEPIDFPGVQLDYKEGHHNVYSMGEVWIRQDNKYSYADKAYIKALGPTAITKDDLENSWIRYEIQKQGVSFPSGLYDLERRLERQEKRVKQALEQAGADSSQMMQHGGAVYGSELEKGIAVENEHRKTLESIAEGSSDVDEAIRKTAEDHLKEDPRYYTKLLEMEEMMAQGGIVNSRNFRFYYTDAPPIYDIFSTETVDLMDLFSNGKQIRKVAISDRSLDAQRKRYRSGNHSLYTIDEFQGFIDNVDGFFVKGTDGKKFNDSVKTYEGVTFHSENGGFRNITSEKLLSDVVKVLGEDVQYQDTDQAVDALKDIGVASVFVKKTEDGFVVTDMRDYQGEPILNAKSLNSLAGTESKSDFLDELHPLDLWSPYKGRLYRKFQIPTDAKNIREFTDMGIKERFSDPVNGHYEVVLSVLDRNEADKVSEAFMEMFKIKSSKGRKAIKVDDAAPISDLTKEQIRSIADKVSDKAFDEWSGNLMKERSLKSEIYKEIIGNEQLYNPQGADPTKLVEQVFEHMLEEERSGSSPKQTEPEESISIKISDYKNPYEVNRGIEELLDKKGPERSAYTPEEIAFLSYYSGYGGLEKYGNFSTEELKGLLFEYYTPDEVVQKMWGLAYKYGYGSIGDNSVFEPSVGIGAFLKYAPLNVRVVANEISRYSAMIAQILYPHAEIRLTPFEKNFIQSNLSIKAKIAHLPKYSLVIGNPPYGRLYSKYISMGEDKYTKASNFTEYFISRGLDLVVPGGLLIYVVGAEQYNGGTLFLDGADTPAKVQIFEKSDLIDAYRLPTKIFERTGVSSEIIVLKKR